MMHGQPKLMPPVVSATELTRCLVAIAVSRDRAAFQTLFEHYAPQLKRYFIHGGVPPTSADDLAQETMLRVWVKAGQFDPLKGSPSAWVFTIARNFRLTRLRDRQFALMEDDNVMGVKDPTPGPDSLLSAQEMQSQLRQDLEKLTSIQADLLKATFFEDKSHLEIARERNMPVGTVKSHIRRALIRLSRMLPEGL